MAELSNSQIYHPRDFPGPLKYKNKRVVDNAKLNEAICPCLYKFYFNGGPTEPYK